LSASYTTIAVATNRRSDLTLVPCSGGRHTQRRGASVLDSARHQNGQNSSLQTQRAQSSCLAPASSQTARRRCTLRQRQAPLVHTSSPSWTPQRGGAGAKHRCAQATSATVVPPAPRTHPRTRLDSGGHRPTTTLPPPCHHHLASPPPRPHCLATTTSPPPYHHPAPTASLPPPCCYRLVATPLPPPPCHHLALKAYDVKASAAPNPPRENLEMQVVT
jgi:hypothetical protein